jgi:hypothetical protein
LYSPPDIIRQIKSRRMRWTGHVVCMGGERNMTGFWWESLKEKDHLKDQGVDGRMGSKWTVGRLVGGGEVKWIHLAQGRNCLQALMNAVMKLWVLVPHN